MSFIAMPATAFVGREDELRRAVAVFHSAVAERRARMVVILGSPGLGKSRMIDEISCRLSDASEVVQAGSLYHLGEESGGATFAPIAKALRVGAVATEIDL